MGKKEDHKQDLANFFDEFLRTGDEEKITEYLTSNSNLPGRRANLELARAFAELAEDHSAKDSERLWDLCIKLTEVSPDEAPVDDPKEFLPFCGACAMGAIGSVSSGFFLKALSCLKELAKDPRWRTREAVAMGIQKLVGKQGQRALKELEGWIVKGNWLEMRAVVAGVAEPALLRNDQTARWALELHKRISGQILTAEERKSVEFKTLKKGLGYSLSVVIYAIPKEGFEYMYRLIDSQDLDILWIVKENLKKNRLIKNFPDEVASIKKLLK
ncbi:MAG: hypothetical protein H3Z50_04615 [archaeon]|nr:hypothetical protein [archaeon]MCP8306906.1 hypothetical protein [archaeon]